MPPAPGEFLKSPRGRIAYRIFAGDRIDPRKNAKRYGLKISVVRVAAGDVPVDARIHEWRWDARKRSRSALR